MFIYTIEIDTPLGKMIACANFEGICLLEFTDREGLEKQKSQLKQDLKTDFIDGENEHLVNLEYQLNEYFDKKRRAFELPLVITGTAFQKNVWSTLLEIPFGKTMTYNELSHKLGDPKAIRAVAGANGANKIAILIPCHRVVGSDGSLTGYAGGIWRKQWLLEHESEQLNLGF